MLKELKTLVRHVKLSLGDVPISTSTHAIPRKELEELKKAGATNMVIPLDACSERVFEEVKGVKAGGPYRWVSHWKALEEALKVFGGWRVGTHLILGLGETEFEAVAFELLKSRILISSPISLTNSIILSVISSFATILVFPV